MTDATTFPCVQCGSPVPRNAQFCLVCGTPASSRSQAAALGQAVAHAPQTAPDGSPIAGWRPAPAASPITRADLIPSNYGRRVVAFLIDGVIGVLFWLLVTTPLTLLGVIDVQTRGMSFAVTGLSAVLLLVPALVVPLVNLFLQSFLGFSLGMLVMGLRLVNVHRLVRPGLGWMIVRGLVVYAASLVLGLGQFVVYLSPLWDPQRLGRGWHDKAAQTWMIDIKAGANPLKAVPGQVDATEVAQEHTPAAVPPVAPGTSAPAPAPQAPTAAPYPAAPAAAPAPAPSAPISSVPGFAPAAPVITPAEIAAAADDPESTRLTDSGRGTIPQGVTRFRLDSGEIIPVTRHGVLGRDPVSPTSDPSDILIALAGDTLSVSKTHLEFGVDEASGSGAVWVSDRGSTNGSAIVRGDGAEYVLDPGERITLVAGDRVRVGTRMLAVEVSA
ncbi:MAG: FHA domain-containing protein [Herbiconiux sp.]|uniref:RDD family protein n=1 Tax=Herbiconiux sp. TaxID=1871186 RepID=UPI00121B3BDA|nr:RDD family protein [Herbiconiux sp.]TAJ48213.1 MAG: FHA domain-containing protein [Herbiconiux sp.]